MKIKCNNFTITMELQRCQLVTFMVVFHGKRSVSDRRTDPDAQYQLPTSFNWTWNVTLQTLLSNTKKTKYDLLKTIKYQ